MDYVLLNMRLIGGVGCYIAVMVLFVAAFKRGGSLTVLYPIYSSTFIWAAAIAWWVYAGTHQAAQYRRNALPRARHVSHGKVK